MKTKDQRWVGCHSTKSVGEQVEERSVLLVRGQKAQGPEWSSELRDLEFPFAFGAMKGTMLFEGW